MRTITRRCSPARAGEVWTAWVAFKDGANFVMARRFDGSSWGPVNG
ncbi:MAG: hypothetical protein R2748_06245 [Bryobacterales bacterium]